MSQAVPIEPGSVQQADASDKKKLLTLLLCIFLGYLGIHRFYVGKALSGLFWLLTGGIVGIGVVVDAVLILFNAFTDKHGKTLREWT